MIQKIKSVLFENKTDKQTIIKNTFFFTLWELMMKVFVFAIFIIIGRKLSLTDFWNLNFLTTFIWFFVVLSDFGTNTILFKKIAWDFEKHSIEDILHVKKILLLFAFFLCIWLYYILGFTISIYLLILASLYLLIKYIWDSCKFFYKWSNNFQKEFYLKLFELLIYIIIFIFFIFKKNINIDIVLETFLYTQVIITLWYLYNIKKDFNINFITYYFKKDHVDLIKKWFFYWWAWILAMINFSFDQILLKFFWLTEELWLYSWVFRLISIGLMFIGYIFVPIFPHLIKKYKDNDLEYIKRFNIRYVKMIFLFWLVTIPIVYFLWEFILFLIFWEKFIAWSIYLFILYISFVIIFLREPAWYTLTALNKQQVIFYTLLIGAIFNICMNLIFIPQYWALWASYTTLFTELFTLMIYIYFIVRFLKNEK